VTIKTQRKKRKKSDIQVHMRSIEHYDEFLIKDKKKI